MGVWAGLPGPVWLAPGHDEPTCWRRLRSGMAALGWARERPDRAKAVGFKSPQETGSGGLSAQARARRAPSLCRLLRGSWGTRIALRIVATKGFKRAFGFLQRVFESNAGDRRVFRRGSKTRTCFPWAGRPPDCRFRGVAAVGCAQRSGPQSGCAVLRCDASEPGMWERLGEGTAGTKKAALEGAAFSWDLFRL